MMDVASDNPMHCGHGPMVPPQHRVCGGKDDRPWRPSGGPPNGQSSRRIDMAGNLVMGPSPMTITAVAAADGTSNVEWNNSRVRSVVGALDSHQEYSRRLHQQEPSSSMHSSNDAGSAAARTTNIEVVSLEEETRGERLAKTWKRIRSSFVAESNHWNHPRRNQSSSSSSSTSTKDEPNKTSSKDVESGMSLDDNGDDKDPNNTSLQSASTTSSSTIWDAAVGWKTKREVTPGNQSAQKSLPVISTKLKAMLGDTVYVGILVLFAILVLLGVGILVGYISYTIRTKQ